MLLNLDKDLGEFKKNKEPSSMVGIRYLFLTWGIDYTAFNKLPLPYIFDMLGTHRYVKEQEEKAYKKANKKR